MFEKTVQKFVFPFKIVVSTKHNLLIILVDSSTYYAILTISNIKHVAKLTISSSLKYLK